MFVCLFICLRSSMFSIFAFCEWRKDVDEFSFINLWCLINHASLFCERWSRWSSSVFLVSVICLSKIHGQYIFTFREFKSPPLNPHTTPHHTRKEGSEWHPWLRHFSSLLFRNDVLKALATFGNTVAPSQHT